MDFLEKKTFTMDNKMNKVYEEIVRNKFPEFAQMLEDCMDFNRWGFRQSFYGLAPGFAPSIIYDSEYCRVRFLWHKGDPRDGYDTLGIEYGRTHAPNDQRYMDCKGKKSHVWHDVRLALKFLDGISPSEAVKIRFKWPQVMDKFIQTHKRGALSHIEWTARMHAYVWNYYGHRLFDLFDLRNPELWEQYAAFIKEFYRIDPGIYNPSRPPLEDIC